MGKQPHIWLKLKNQYCNRSHTEVVNSLLQRKATESYLWIKILELQIIKLKEKKTQLPPKTLQFILDKSINKVQTADIIVIDQENRSLSIVESSYLMYLPPGAWVRIGEHIAISPAATGRRRWRVVTSRSSPPPAQMQVELRGKMRVVVVALETRRRRLDLWGCCL